MIELLFVACLATDPLECRQRSLVFTGITPMTCMMGAQPELARWTVENPKFRVTQWKCRVVSYAEVDA